MTRYLLSIYQPDGEAPPLETLAAWMRDMNALVDDAKAAGVWVFNAGLLPPATATVVQFARGDALVTDGPFIESKEHIGGFLIINVPDLDAAIAWARRMAKILTLPGRETEGGLPIEIRPLHGDRNG